MSHIRERNLGPNEALMGVLFRQKGCNESVTLQTVDRSALNQLAAVMAGCSSAHTRGEPGAQRGIVTGLTCVCDSNHTSLPKSAIDAGFAVDG